MSKRKSHTVRIGDRLFKNIKEFEEEFDVPFTTAGEIYAKAVEKKIKRAKKADEDGDFIDFF